jgi:putative salt-induced outer membrane protein YdiY
MRSTLILLAALSALLAWMPPAAAQSSRAGASASFAQAQRSSVELTALRNTGSSAAEPWQGSLHWTYAWASERTLQVVFAAKTPEQWYVNSWDWSNY